MSIEINFEALSSLSIADPLALDKKFEDWNDLDFHEHRVAISKELQKRINDIFIL